MPPGPGPTESADEAARSAAHLQRGELPLMATARLQGMQASGSWTSDLSVDEFVAVRGVGFDPVGQVMGSTVDNIGWRGGGACGAIRGMNYGLIANARLSPSGVAGTGGRPGGPWTGYPHLVKALYAARHRAMSRLEQECRALDADGVVGVHLQLSGFPGAADAIEFQAIGTAIRARGGRHLVKPFLSDLSGQDFAKLVLSGWVPCGLAFGVAVGIRHDDYRTVGVTRSWQNGEVPGYTELVHRVRAEVRSELATDVARHGGAGVTVRDMDLRIWEQECQMAEGFKDHVAQATVFGTAIVPFQRRDARRPPSSMAILRLDQAVGNVIGRRLSNDTLEG